VGACIISALGVLLMSFLTYFKDQNFLVFGAVVCLVFFLTMMIISCYEILINSFIPKDKLQDRATIISSGSMARSILTLLFSIPAGGMTAETSPIGWSLPAVLLIITSVGTYISIRKYENKASQLRIAPNEIAIEGSPDAS
jgi:MFS family permease